MCLPEMPQKGAITPQGHFRETGRPEAKGILNFRRLGSALNKGFINLTRVPKSHVRVGPTPGDYVRGPLVDGGLPGRICVTTPNGLTLITLTACTPRGQWRGTDTLTDSGGPAHDECP